MYGLANYVAYTIEVGVLVGRQSVDGKRWIRIWPE